MVLAHKDWVSKLGLIKHPEGGYYKEFYRSRARISGRHPVLSFEGERALATSIYFLLPSGEVSRFHRLKSDELWYFHAGSSLTITIIQQEGTLREVKLGLEPGRGEQPQAMIPAGCIFGAEVDQKGSFALVGCMVTPGFDFRDFKLFSREELISQYPQHREVIEKLT